MSTATCSAARYCFRVIALSNLLFRDTTQTKSTSKITSLLRWNVDVSWSAFSTRSSLPFSNASYCPAEAFTPEQLAELYDINVLSTQRVNRVALPQMRKQRQGLLIWVSSRSSA